MAAQLPDTPGNSPGRGKDWPRERSTFSIDAAEEHNGSPHSQQGFDRPDQTVFDLTMDYSDEETLLDWEQYAGMRKFKCWGMDCSLIARFCPFMPCVPQEWYYRFSKRQRKLMTIGFATFLGLLVLLIGATVLLVLLPNKDAPTNALGYSVEECAWSSYHLPSGITPTQYDLEMSTEMQPPFLVVGAVTVHVNISRPSKCLVLHALDMNITHMNRLDPHSHGNWSFNNQEQLILEFDEPLRPPSANFAVHFNYTLKQGLSGFYRSSYQNAAGETQVLATTQMEANNARKAFPCFDEPAMKAVWNFSMTAPAEQTVLFNMPGNSTVKQGGKMVTSLFAPTPPMASYLVAFIVGNLTAVGQMVPTLDGLGPERPVSVYGIPEREGSLKMALDVATTVLPEYERLFGVDYALPKLDLVAIPDFAAGAMENWGLITYRETDLLFNVNESSLQNERRIALVIAHEMAHLWFGDLVTMKDWGELWLNEGFATYFENVGASIARPDFAYYDTFYSDFATAAMEIDSYPKSTHPLATLSGMDTAEKVEAMFDGISYDKGGSVLRMLRAYLNRLQDPKPLLRRSMLQILQDNKLVTQKRANNPDCAMQDSPPVLERETFLKGLRNYLQKYSFNNTSSNDLWAEMDNVTNEDVTGWMKAWTFQPGIPRLEILSDGPAHRALTVYQAPFQFNGPESCNPKGSLESGTAPWWIPMAFFSKDSAAVEWQTLSACTMPKPIYTLKDDDDWFKLNAGQYGLFRVSYPNFLWDRLATAAQIPPKGSDPPAIPAEDLAGLLDDSWALLQSGERDPDKFLALTKALGLRHSAEYAPWSVAVDHMIEVYRYLQLRPSQDCADRWATFVRGRIVDPTLGNNTQLALDSQQASEGAGRMDIQARLLRPLLASLSNEFNDTGARLQAQGIFQNASTLRANPDIRGVVYAFMASSNQQSSYDRIKDLYIQAIDPSEKSRALGALPYAEDSILSQQTLEFALSKDVRSQDTTRLVASVAYRGGSSLKEAWNFLKSRYSDIAEKLGGQAEAADAMGKLIRNVASRFADNSALAEVEAIFRDHSQYLTEPRMEAAARENIQGNILWMERNAEKVCKWLNEQG